MIAFDDLTEIGSRRSFFWCMNFPSTGFQVMSMMDEPITKLEVGDYVEHADPEHVLWEVKSTDENETVLIARYLSLGAKVVKIGFAERTYETADLMPMIRVQIKKESE